MTSDETYDRFAARPVIAEVNDRLGVGLTLVGLAVHGDSGGAAYIQWPDGRQGVLTLPPTTMSRMQVAADVLTLVRSRGLPVPCHELAVELADGRVAVVQERLPGRPAERITVDVINAMWATNEQFRDVLADRPDVPIPSLHLRHSAPDCPRHDLLESYDDQTRRLLERIHEVGAEPPTEMTGTDLVHLDYARGNVLFDTEGVITGVVDWNLGVARGDRRLGLVCLRSDLEWTVLDPQRNPVDRSAIDRLDQIIEEQIDPSLQRKYWAYWTLQKLHWAILQNATGTIDLFLRLGENRPGVG